MVVVALAFTVVFVQVNVFDVDATTGVVVLEITVTVVVFLHPFNGSVTINEYVPPEETDVVALVGVLPPGLQE